MGNGEKLFLIGIVLSVITLIATGTFNFSFAKVQNVRFEIAECSVQGNSTYEKSGPCPVPNSKPDLSKGPESSISEPSPKVSAVSKEKTEPAPKISSLEAADQAEASPTVSSISEKEKTEPAPKISSLEAADQAEASSKVSSVTEKEKTEPAPKISSLEAADQAEASTRVHLDNSVGDTGIEDVSDANNIKYNFDDLHISGPDQEAAKIPEQSAALSPVPKVVEPIDPFGSVTK
jgi:hypothetical protein